MTPVALVALLSALALFWVSTRQFPIMLRLLVWLTSAALLALAAALTMRQPNHFGLLHAIADAWAQRDDLSSSALYETFAQNAGAVAQFVPQLLDPVIVAGALLGALALLALTPGQALERALRPTILALFGFIAGCAAALAVAAFGFGGHIKPRAYVGYVNPEAVHDGDTFLLGEVSLRLWGVDAPELQQDCRGGEHCGVAARDHLAELMENALIQCSVRRRQNGRPVETFGRPLATCWARRGDARVDLAEQMIREGFAIPYQGDAEAYPAAAAEGIGRNLLANCWLRPDDWRNDRAARAAFESGEPLPDCADLVGACEPAAAQP